MNNDDDLTHQIDFLQQRVEALQQDLDRGLERAPVSRVETCEELRGALEELRVCQEEVRQQNEELVVTQGAVEAERQRYQELFEFAPDGYVVTDPDGMIREANRAAARLLAISQPTLVGKPLAVFIVKEDRPSLRTHLLALRTSRQRQEWEGRLKPHRGTPFPASIAVVPLRDAEETGQGLQWLICDITVSKETEEALRKATHELNQRIAERTEQLRHANQALQEEITTRKQAEERLVERERLAVLSVTAEKVAHEIGNALNSLSTTVQLQRRYLNTHHSLRDDTLESSVEDLLHEIRRLSRVVHAWRSIAQPPRLRLEPTALPPLLGEVLAMPGVRGALPARTVTQDFSPDLSGVRADRQKLKQALLNVCISAGHAMPQGGTLSVRAYNAEDRVRVEIAHTGVPLPAEPAEIDLFDLFTTTQPRSLSLGLAIAQQIIVAHRGTLTSTTEAGKGTVFRVSLPQH